MWIIGVCFLTIASITVAMDADCEKPLIWDYDSSMACCKDSAITYTDEVMSKCKKYNRSSIPINKDLILTSVCDIQCYLNSSRLMNTDGSIRQKQLVDLLRKNFQHPEVKALVGRLTSKCLSEGDLPANATTLSRVQKARSNESFAANCQPYYASLVDCIQAEIFTNCPERIRNQSAKCAATRLFVRYCGVGKLREMLAYPDLGHEDSNEESSRECKESDEASSKQEDSDEDSDLNQSESVSESTEADSEDDFDSESESKAESVYGSERKSSGNETMVLATDSAARQEKLLNFLRHNLQSNELKALLGNITRKCSSKGHHKKGNKNLHAKCQSYYASLTDCIQDEIFMNCPETISNPTEKCAAIHLFVRYCDKLRLREMFGDPGAGGKDSNENSSSEYENSDSEQSESESKSRETCKCGSRHGSGSKHKSDRNSESESSENEPTELSAASVVRQEKLLEFLRDNLQSDEVKTLLGKITSKCSSKGEHIKRKKNFDVKCQPYYASLIDCIQNEIFTNCPERLSNPPGKCAATQLFVRYCGMERLEKMFTHSDASDGGTGEVPIRGCKSGSEQEDSDEDSSSEYKNSDSDQSESELESESSEASKSDSEDYSDSEHASESESNYDYDSE